MACDNLKSYLLINISTLQLFMYHDRKIHSNFTESLCFDLMYEQIVLTNCSVKQASVWDFNEVFKCQCITFTITIILNVKELQIFFPNFIFTGEFNKALVPVFW